MTSKRPRSGGDVPPSWGAEPHDPYAQDRALSSWAKKRGYQIVTPNPSFWAAWYPLHFFRRIVHVYREIRFEADEARVSVGDVLVTDDFGLSGQMRTLYFFLRSARLKARAAARTKAGAGFVEDVNRGLNELGMVVESALGGRRRPAYPPVLGDPVLEARCDVLVPNRAEGDQALTPALRAILLSPHFGGAVELRHGGMAVHLYGYHAFEPYTLDAAIAIVGHLYSAASPKPPATPYRG